MLSRRRVVASRFVPPAIRRRWLLHQSGLPPTGRVFGIGLSRTGTTSLTRALTLLGYRTIHYPDDECTSREVIGCIQRSCKRLRLSILESRDAATDIPISATFEALDAAYPGSRFILTTRARESWLDSCSRYWEAWNEPLLRRKDDAAMYMAVLHERLYAGASFNVDRFARSYDDFHTRVRNYFADRPDDLLTLDLCERAQWGPLCAFLDAPPPRADFPWEANH
jgi:hypothetical protein